MVIVVLIAIKDGLEHDQDSLSANRDYDHCGPLSTYRHQWNPRNFHAISDLKIVLRSVMRDKEGTATDISKRRQRLLVEAVGVSKGIVF